MTVWMAVSSVALAVHEVTRERNKVFVDSGAGTADLTGPQCSLNTVHWTFDTVALANGHSAVVKASLSAERPDVVREDNAGKQISGRVAITPFAGFIAGVSGAHGTLATRSAAVAAGLSTNDRSITQDAVGGDLTGLETAEWLVKRRVPFRAAHLAAAKAALLMGGRDRHVHDQELAAFGKRLDQRNQFAAFMEKVEAVPGQRLVIVDAHRQRLAAGDRDPFPVGLARERPHGGRIGGHGGRYTDVVLNAHQLQQHFDAVISGDTYPTKKPNPASVLDILSQWQVATNEALFVGDSSIDAATARNAGLAIWLLPYGYNMGQPVEASQPDRVIHNLAELL